MTPRTFLLPIAAAVSLIVGCANGPEAVPAGAANKPAPTAAQSAVNVAQSTGGAVRTVDTSGRAVICTWDANTGTRIRARRCETVEDAEARNSADREWVNQVRTDPPDVAKR